MNKLNIRKVLGIVVIVLLVIINSNEFNDSFAFKSKFDIENNLEIYFFDVGQADSILIKQNDNSILIDAGNNDDGNYIVDFLKNDIGLTDIDMVVGTHPHEDHIGGLDNVIDSFDIGSIYMPDVISTSKTFEDVIDVIENKNYDINIPLEDENIEFGDIKFNVLYVGNDEENLNNSSIVLKMKFGNTSYLFTGDAEDVVEKLILDKDIDVDVLKVGHHGSRYSTSKDFLDKVNPKYAIIMVGNDNSYNHPHKETLDRLTNGKVEIIRTDKDGTIKLISDGNDIKIEKLNVSLNG